MCISTERQRGEVSVCHFKYTHFEAFVCAYNWLRSGGSGVGIRVQIASLSLLTSNSLTDNTINQPAWNTPHLFFNHLTVFAKQRSPPPLFPSSLSIILSHSHCVQMIRHWLAVSQIHNESKTREWVIDYWPACVQLTFIGRCGEVKTSVKTKSVLQSMISCDQSSKCVHVQTHVCVVTLPVQSMTWPWLSSSNNKSHSSSVHEVSHYSSPTGTRASAGALGLWQKLWSIGLEPRLWSTLKGWTASDE